LIGEKQSTAWKIGNAIRLMMSSRSKELSLLSGTIRMDEKFIRGKPRHLYGVRHKGGKAKLPSKVSFYLFKGKALYSRYQLIP